MEELTARVTTAGEERVEKYLVDATAAELAFPRRANTRLETRRAKVVILYSEQPEKKTVDKMQ